MVKPQKSKNQKIKKSKPTTEKETEEVDYWRELQKVKKEERAEIKLVDLNALKNDQQQRKKKLFFIVAVLMVLIFIGWIWSLRLYLNQSPDAGELKTQAEWQSVASDLDKSLASIRSNFSALADTWNKLTDQQKVELKGDDLLKLKAGLIAEATKDWTTYNNFDHNFSLKYPADWKQAIEKDKIVFLKDKTTVTVEFGPVLEAANSEVVALDNITARRYHMGSDPQNPLDRVAIDLPDKKSDVYITGFGSEFEKMVLTFKLIESL